MTLHGRFNPLTATADTKSGRQSVRIGICTPSACTADDLNVLVSRGSFLKVAKIFSAVSNTKALLKTENTGLNKSLLFLSGLKVFCAYWVLLDHEYIALQAEFLHSPFELMRLSSKPWFQFITNGVLSVSTFFFMSGFALSFSMAGSNATIRSFAVAIARRYIRLTFPVMVVVLMAFLLPLIADGPADSELLPQQLSGCYTNWWTLLFHVNDFLPQKQMCLTHLWYVAADMQIFAAVTLPLAVLLNWNNKAGFALAFTICAAFGSLAAAQTYIWHLFHGITFGNSDVRRFSNTLEYIHFKPFVHIPTYVCGTVSGFLSNRVKGRPLRQTTQALCWFLSACLLCSVMFVTIPWNDGRFPADSVTALYGGFHRLVWALGLSWPFIACANGKASFLYKFLAWKAFLPLSRLTYGIYLTHLLFHLLRMANTKTPINVDEFLQLRNSIGTFGLSVALAYVLYIICDGPTQQIERLLFRKTVTSRASTSPPGNETAAKPCSEVVSNGTA
ncbi:nose resistant to fluoxetine protein 6-like [Rhipicephalus sanguineus]|uniref:nose resistant to fluoxetine protein 6-like n=1 Tax=Rhipicephalus sanguineus TaxID=34632 RepID=UPI0020C32C88|nr:nose resistant to fluoxetine protein 6-like [Rhipicephalus sanguineus]